MLSFRFMCYLLALSSGKKAKINIHLFMHVLRTWKLRWFHGKNAPGWPCYYYCYYDYYYGKFFFLRDKIFPILINTLNFKQSVTVLIFYIYQYNIHLKYNIVLRCIPLICSSVGKVPSGFHLFCKGIPCGFWFCQTLSSGDVVYSTLQRVTSGF